MPSFLKVFLAFSAYAVFHSLLLTEGARSVLEAVLGPRAFRGWFRFGYTVQATVLLAAFVAYAANLPDTLLLRLSGLPMVLLRLIQIGGLAYIGYCTVRLGTFAFLGLENLRAWWQGGAPAGDGVETGRLVIEGPYRRIRHPMYAAGFIVLWASPDWTANGVAFALAASLYLWLGALHEEHRLLRTYGDEYRRYMGETPRFVPRRATGS